MYTVVCLVFFGLHWFGVFSLGVRFSIFKRKKRTITNPPPPPSLTFSVPPLDFPYRNYLFLSLFDQTNITHIYLSNDTESWELLAIKRKLQGKTQNFLESTLALSSLCLLFLSKFCVNIRYIYLLHIDGSHTAEVQFKPSQSSCS